MKLLLSRHTLSFLTFVLLGITTTLTFSAAKQSSSIEWDSPFSSTTGYFYAIGMCKGTTDKTRKVGFIGSAEGAIHRTLDGVNWHRVAQFYTSLYWYGIYCFPDAQRVLAVGFSDGGDMDSGAIIAWSFNGGRNWTNPQLMPDTGELTNLQAVHFYNDTHGIILPSIQDSTPSLIYYTSNGGKNASDWKAVQVPGVFLQWYQSHPIRVFDGVTKTFAQADAGSQYCWSDDAGLSWKCDSLDQPVLIGSFVSSKEAIGVGGHTQVYSSRDGGRAWTRTSALPADYRMHWCCLLTWCGLTIPTL